MALFTHTESLNKIWQDFITLSLSHFLWTRSHGLSRSLSLSLDAFTRSVSYLSSPLLSLFSLVSLSLSLFQSSFVYICAIRNAIWYENLLLTCVGKCWDGGEKTRKKITEKSGVILFCLVCEAFCLVAEQCKRRSGCE